MTTARPGERRAADVDAGSVEPGASIASIAEPDAVDARAVDDADAQIARRYEVGADIGAGAMGRVSLVHDRRLLRDVAWKRGDGRILREARILAQLEHPGIVPIYDMGFDQADAPFFAMRVVRGRSLARVLAETTATARSSLLRPLLQAIEAVAYAHHRGVVHRDLKPANIMIGDFGETQVVDWGLARVLDDARSPIADAARGALVAPGAVRVGTPGYMSPEQEAGRPADRRADVYALGRILGELIDPAGGTTGAPPPELVAIAARACEPDPAHRYADAADLAADLARYLDGGRVQAHRYRAGELLRRFARAYRVPLVVGVVALVALAVLLVRYVADIGAQRDRAEAAEADVRAALDRSDLYLSRALVGEARRQAAQGMRAEAELLAAHALTLHEDADARGLIASFAGAPSLELVARAALPCPGALVDPRRELVLCTRFDGVSLWGLRDGELTRRWSFVFPHHAARLVDGGVALAAPLEVVALDLEGRVTLRARAPNNTSKRASTVDGVALFEGNGVSVLVDVGRGVVEGVTPCEGALHSALAIRAAGGSGPALAVSLCRDGTLRRAGVVVSTPFVGPERQGARLALAGPDLVVLGTNKGEVALLDRQGRVVRSAPLVAGMVRLLAPSPDGRFLLAAGEGDPIVIVSLPELASIASLPRRAQDAAWDPARPSELVSTGRWLERWRLGAAAPDRPALGAYRVPLRDGVVALDVDTRAPSRLAAAVGPHVALLTPRGTLEASPGFVTVKGAVLEGDRLVAAGAKGVWRFDADTLGGAQVVSDLSVRRIVMLADSRSIVASYMDLRRLDADGMEVIAPGAALDLSASPDGRFAVALREDDHALLRLRAGDPTIEIVGSDPLADAVAIGSGGDDIYTARAGEVVRWDELGRLTQVHLARAAQLTDVEVSLDGRWVAAGARHGAVYVWAAGEPEPRARFLDHLERVPALAFSIDGRWLASGSWDRSVRVRDLAALELPAAALRELVARRWQLELAEALGGEATGGR